MKKEEMEQLAKLIVNEFLTVLSRKEEDVENSFLQEAIMFGTSYEITDEEC